MNSTMEKISLRDAVKTGVERVRRDPWEPSSHLKLPILPDGMYGPWGHICCGYMEDQTVLMLQMDMDEVAWEPWKEEVA